LKFVKKNRDSPHYERGEYVGPFPSGAPAIFVDTGARLGMKTGIVGGIGNDEFGKVIKDRLERDSVDTRKLLVFEGITTGIAFVMYFSSGERRFVFTLKQSAAAQVKARTYRRRLY
jgi:Sugar kinases, ribokinase family